jgi:4-aminobutyrate aminotransferase / (S)-3-amino-2-methylpropionate transaminase / 5-aminovalerate transaminase
MAIEIKTEIPGPLSRSLMEVRRNEMSKAPFHTTPIFVKKAKGAVIEDVDGNRLIDFAAGIGVTNTGHAPDSVIKAIAEQAQMFLHTSFNVLAYSGYVDVCKKLNELTPGKFKKKTFLINSGAEAVENAIKVSRTFTKRQAVICFDHAFHGRTYMAMTLTSKAKPYRYECGPYSSEVYRAPFPYCYRWPTGSDPEQVSNECFQQFEELVNSRIGATQVAAVIIEPVLGEGGFVPAPKNFMKRLRDFCTTHGIVLIADEIQTGFGRTGSIYACEQLGVEPDLITSAKGLAGGMPLSALTGRAEIMDSPIDGGIGGTFGGNPLSCVAALEVIKLFEKGAILKNAAMVAGVLNRRLSQWKEKFTSIGDVRGLGPMMALEFVRDRKTKVPYPELAKKLTQYCYEHGVVLMSAGTYSNVTRFLCPLSIDEATLNEGLDVVEKGLQELSKS